MEVKDVVIVGGGPVGLFSALLLGMRNVSVTLYERWPTFYPLPRACGVDHEIVRMLQDAGLADELEPLLDPIIGPDKAYEFVDETGDTLLKIDWNRPGVSGWAQMNMFYQPDLEHALARRLERYPNVVIRRGLELVDLEQDDGAVSLAFNGSDGERLPVRDRARYVIGADGARSAVRQALGIGQTDLGFIYDWLVVDVSPHTERIWKPYVVQHCNPARPTTLVASGPGRRRWEFMRMPHESIEVLNTAEKAWELLAPWNINPGNATLERHAVYTFRGAWADRWREGRVFLAGDAAHLMPPFLGQGLCAGMRDALALAWRLPMVLRDGVPDTLLASYGPERSGHVQEIIHQAVEMGRLICMLDPDEVQARNSRMKAALEDPSLALKPPPEPRLGGSDLYCANDDQAGYLAIQARVRRGGSEGLFDDVVGKGWQLLLRSADRRHSFGASAREVIDRLGVAVAEFGAAGDTFDLEGAYSTFFDRVGADAVLVRPDFYIFGTSSLRNADELLVSAWRAIEGRRLRVGEAVEQTAA